MAETENSPFEAEALVPPHTLADIQVCCTAKVPAPALIDCAHQAFVVQKKDQAARTMDASMFKPSRARSLHLVHRDSILEVTDMLDSLQVPAHGASLLLTLADSQAPVTDLKQGLATTPSSPSKDVCSDSLAGWRLSDSCLGVSRYQGLHGWRT